MTQQKPSYLSDALMEHKKEFSNITKIIFGQLLPEINSYSISISGKNEEINVIKFRLKVLNYKMQDNVKKQIPYYYWFYAYGKQAKFLKNHIKVSQEIHQVNQLKKPNKSFQYQVAIISNEVIVNGSKFSFVSAITTDRLQISDITNLAKDISKNIEKLSKNPSRHSYFEHVKKLQQTFN